MPLLFVLPAMFLYGLFVFVCATWYQSDLKEELQ